MDLRNFSVENEFDSSIIDKAWILFRRGMSSNKCEWRNSAGPVWATDIGAHQAYAGFQPDERTNWKFVCGCEACMQDKCAHAAALSIKIMANHREELARWQEHLERFTRINGKSYAKYLPKLPEATTGFDSWISDQSQASAKELEKEANSIHASNPSDAAIFVLANSETDPNAAQVEIGFSRPMKTKDQMTKLERIQDLTDWRTRFLMRGDPLLRRYFQWVATNLAWDRMHGKGTPNIQDQQGVDLIADIAAEKRLFGFDRQTERPVGPLVKGEERLLEWSWKEDVFSNWLVTPHVPGGGQFFLSTTSLYVDLETKTFGSLNLGGMSTPRAIAMLTSPPIPKKWLATNFKSPEALRCLPRPPSEIVERNSRMVSGVPPLPVLAVAITNKKDVFRIGLSFRYDDVSCFYAPGSDRIQFIKKGVETIELVRDTATEEKSLAALGKEGLVLSDKEGDLRFAGEKSAQVEGFRKLLATDFTALRQAGFIIETVEGWKSKVFEPDSVAGGFGDTDEGIGSPSAAVHFSLGFFIDGQRYNLLPLIGQLMDIVGGAEGVRAMTQALNDGLKLPGQDALLWVVDEDGRWIGLPRAQMIPWLQTLAALMADRSTRLLSGPSIKLSRIEALSLEADFPEVQFGSNGVKIIKELLEAKSSTSQIAIKGFNGVLEPFQCAGFKWLTVLSKYQLGGILGDDRGLGKTVQCVAHLADLKSRCALTAPALIVVPPTQIHHWRHHIHALAPDINLLTLYGIERSTLMGSAAKYDAVLTSWDSVMRYVEVLRSQRFHVAFLDETEKIHNASTLVSKSLRLLNIGYEIALNGSPVENHYGDVWSVFDAVLPGYLGSQTAFKRMFRIPIEQNSDATTLKTLKRRIAPFMLRRLKGESGVNLPPVVHEDVPLKIKGPQANLYELIRITTEETVREAMASSGLRGEPISILPILTKLRQVCCDPSLTEVGREQGIMGSAKLDWLRTKIDTLHTEGRRVLLVGFFVEFFHLIEDMLNEKGITFSKIIGTMTPAKRETQKQDFKSGKTRVFLLGLKSGGRGTDLPEADTVIHLDPWYNPKAHDQATDRAHRMGQVNTVSNLRLFIEGSIEERVIEIQDRKRQFADSLDSEEIFDEHKVTAEDIMEMLKPLQHLE